MQAVGRMTTALPARAGPQVQQVQQHEAEYRTHPGGSVLGKPARGWARCPVTMPANKRLSSRCQRGIADGHKCTGAVSAPTV